MRIIFLSVLLLILSKTDSQLCNQTDSVELVNRTYDGIQFADDELYLDNNTGVERGCICLKRVCTRKCCPFGQYFNNKIRKCEDNDAEFSPIVWKDGEVMEDFDFKNDFHVVIGPEVLKCDIEESRVIITPVLDFYSLSTDGIFYTRIESYQYGLIESYYNWTKYCIDNLPDSDNPSTVKIEVVICLVKSNPEDLNLDRLIIRATCMLVSCLFIMVTVAVYGFLPELRTTIHGKVMISYLSSFFLAFLTFGSMLYTQYFDSVSRQICTILTFIIYFSLLSAIFWLNVMSYDIYRKFKDMNVYRDSNSLFYKYCAYAFGIPTLFTIILFGMEKSGLPKNFIFTPNLELGRCFMNGRTRQIYLFIPTFVLCMTNLVFFLLVAKKLIQTKKDTERLGKKNTRQFSLYLKLFVLAGISWAFDVITDLYPNLDRFWVIVDVYNILVGPMVFVIFVCKKKVFISLKEKIRKMRGIQPARSGLPKRTPGTSTTTTPVTQSLESVQMGSIDNKLDKQL